MESYQKRQQFRELCRNNHPRITVLGSGLVASLASNLFQNESIVLTYKHVPLFLDNVYFHDTFENRMMLRLFNLEYVSKVIPVKYFNNFTGRTTEEVTDKIKLQIAREKMGIFNSAQDVVLSTMSDEKPEFRNLFFNESKFKSILASYTPVTTIFPVRITEFENCVRLYFDEFDETMFIDTEYLVNTIPMTFFKDMLSNDIYNRKYEYSSVVFVSYSTNESDSMTYTYNNCFYKRIFNKNGFGCIEIDETDWDENTFRRMFPRITDYKVTKIPYGRIRTFKVPDTPRIKHVGRFAQWDHSITTEHVINKLINLNL